MSQFDFGNANEAQRRAITTTEGPLLITAGPGTGKTFTLVKRVAYLIVEKGVSPSQIMVATFTEKAAKELVTRISTELAAYGVEFDVGEMYVGTFHSICLRIIKEHLEYSTVSKNYRIADTFDQQYIVFQRYRRFKQLEHFEHFPQTGGAWVTASRICTVANTLSEEMIDPSALLGDENPEIVAIGEVANEYRTVIAESNWLDFATIQVEAHKLVSENKAVLDDLAAGIKYVMVDEYQDTNYIQERLTMLLGNNGNICVVGDDDQGLYRFRGATIRNILEFPQQFPSGACERIDLSINYRSDPDIVWFYNDWMERTAGPRFRFDWGGYRYEKKIVAHRDKGSAPAAVGKIDVEDGDDWCAAVYRLIWNLKERGGINDYNQIAFLFRSVKHSNARDLADFLESKGVNVYSPRSNTFFDRNEIRLIIGVLLLLFPTYVQRIERRDFSYVDEGLLKYYIDCIVYANGLLAEPEAEPLRRWIASLGRTHMGLSENTDYALSGLVYQMFEFEPFHNMLDTPLDTGVHDQRAVRNLSTLIGITGKFEYLQRVDIFTPKTIDRILEQFFNTYLRFLRMGGIDEYEDEEEYVPSGCIPFLTIHQSKGMEFPVVVVDSLYSTPTKSYDELLLQIKDRYGNRKEYEPIEDIKYFDFWRLYYTAFSRAQDLLVLTHRPKVNRKIGKAFETPYDELPVIADDYPYAGFDFHTVKESDLKPSLSFTSHISLYEGCSLQYKFFQELGFSPVRVGATVFGRLVHQTIEDVHRAVLRGETESITPENVGMWFQTNYDTLSGSEHAYLSQIVLDAAKRQVMRYVERRSGKWDDIVAAEVQIGLAKDDYIIHGTVDLIRAADGSVELVDFKSEKKPDVNKDYELIEKYHKQLLLYAHLVEEKTGERVSGMRLYYTGVESGNPEVPFSRDSASIESVAAEFDDVAHKILSKDYRCRSSNNKLCENCDFRYYCKN